MAKDSANQHYEFWAQSSEETGLDDRLKRWVEQTYIANIVEALGPAFDANSRKSLLEIGPGKGEFAREAKSYGFDYSAIESSPTLVNRLQEQGVECFLAEFPAGIDRLGGRRFDCVYLSHVLEHQDTRKDAVEFITGVSQLMSPGGLCIINCPNVLSHGTLF